MEMRQVLNQELKKLMAENDKIMLVEADLAKANGTWDVREQYPDRVVDVGIAEQNAATVSAGLASYGYIPMYSSFTAFATRRACDQVSVSICYPKANVKILGTDPGIAAELNGGTHMSVEDIGVMRSIPNMVIFEPADSTELKKALPKIFEHDGPVYMRLFRKEAADIYDDSYNFDLFKADVLQEGSDVTIAAMGPIMMEEAKKAVEKLAAEGVKAELINVHTVKPLDEATLKASIAKTGCIVTCDNHNVIGGLGSAVAEMLVKDKPAPVRMIGIQDHFGEVGFMPYLKEKFKMTADDIVAAAKDAMAAK